MTQLAGRSLLIPVVGGSNPVIGKKTKRKKKRPEMARFQLREIFLPFLSIILSRVQYLLPNYLLSIALAKSINVRLYMLRLYKRLNAH